MFEELYAAGKIELELLPQGTMSERMRCAGAGLGGFYSPVSVGTRLAEGKELREIDGRMYVLEKPLKGDVALITADLADRWGNLTYRSLRAISRRRWRWLPSSRSCRPARWSNSGDLDRHVVTPGIFVNRIVEVAF